VKCDNLLGSGPNNKNDIPGRSQAWQVIIPLKTQNNSVEQQFPTGEVDIF
jgi:hypothetical protein